MGICEEIFDLVGFCGEFGPCNGIWKLNCGDVARDEGKVEEMLVLYIPNPEPNPDI